MRKRDIRRHSPLSLSKNVVLAETSCQRLEIWSCAIGQAFRAYFLWRIRDKLKLNLVLVVLLVCVDIEMNEDLVSLETVMLQWWGRKTQP